MSRKNQCRIVPLRAMLTGLLLLFVLLAEAAGNPTMPGHVPAIAKSLQPIGRLPGTNQLTLAIALPLRNREALTNFLQQLYDPSSTQYRHYVTPEEFATRFGPAIADYKALIHFVGLHGLTVTGTHHTRALLDVRGSVADIEKAFHLTMRVYQHPRLARTFYAPDAEPSLDLAVPVLAISGLDNSVLPHPKYRNQAVPTPGGHIPRGGSGPGGTYLGSDFRAAYVPGVTLDGTGQTVALFEFDSYYTNDIVHYETLAGLRNVPLQNVLIDGYSGIPVDPNNIAEVSLDIEMAIAMAPGLSQVLVYEADPNGGIADDILDQIATDNLAKQISCSWGWSPFDPASDQTFQQFAAQGQSFFSASGDDGAEQAGGTPPIVPPSDDPYVTQVGGTTLTTTGPGGSWVSEQVWSWFPVQPDASSGGISGQYAIPAWQQGIDMTANLGSTTMRNYPDVALTGDNVYVIYDNGQAGSFGGTSCAAPLWAGLTALINQQAIAAGQTNVGFLNPVLYSIGNSAAYAANFHDITTGNNTNSANPNVYYAVPGYDLCTGWGTPIGAALIDTLAPPDALRIRPFAGFVSTGYVGGPFSITNQTFVLTNAGAASIQWSLANTSVWLSASSSGGTLAPGGAAASVVIGLKTAATNLQAGIHDLTIWFTNLSDGVVQTRKLSLQIQPPPDPLQIMPSSGLVFTNRFSLPFAVTNLSFILTNIGPASLDWALANTSQWLTVSSRGGTLASHSPATTVTVGLTGAALVLPSGTYSNALWFTNFHDGVVQNLPVSLQILPLVLNGGFEAGNFSSWTEIGDFSACLISTSPTYVHSGKYGAELGPYGSTSYLSQALPTTVEQLYLFSLWLDSPDGEVPNEFLVSWNGNTLWDQVDLGVTGWTNLQFFVTATTTNSTLEIGFRDDPTYLGLDDISVLPVPMPSFQSVTRTGSTINFAWSALAGLSYQVQYTTNLVLANWIPLGVPITATNSAVALSDTAGPDQQRFYRVVLLP